MTDSSLCFQKYFWGLTDPRVPGRRRHLLGDILFIGICAIISGSDDWVQIETFAKKRLDWLKRFLRLPHGVPSHDTFERVFSALDPKEFARGLTEWSAQLSRDLGIDHIAIDGKTLRGSAGPETTPLHLVSAFACHCRLSLAQVCVAGKSNEITAIPELLRLLDLKGALVSLDAMGTQKKIAEAIIEQGGDYILTVKDNQPRLLEDIQGCFERAFDADFEGFDHDTYETIETGHGRQEKRSYTILTEPEGIRDVDAWDGLKVIGMCLNDRFVEGKWTQEVRYFIGSRVADAKTYGEGLRGHWVIENGLHWQLDVTFAEDANRVQNRNAAANLAAMRKIALGLLKRHPSKASIRVKRFSAALDTAFLEEVLRAKK
jgi:predicted transposase YbfD/YdcC